jgi:drug/metabolite transporter (DMT)-like permease
MDFLLLLVTFFWGSTFILVKSAVEVMDVYSFLGIRFGLAFLIMLLLFPGRIRRINSETLMAGGFLGILLFASFAFQTWGLTLTSATNGAFITGMNVVMVPIFSLIFFKRYPAFSTLFGIISAGLGLYLLLGMSIRDWNFGDVLVLFCAAAVALHILMTERYAPKFDVLVLVTWQLGVSALLGISLSISLGKFTFQIPFQAWMAVVITVLFCTVMAYIIQTYAQRTTPASRAALIFTAEPVFGALFAHYFGNEPLLTQQIFGGGLIFIGMVISKIRFKPGRSIND